MPLDGTEEGLAQANLDHLDRHIDRVATDLDEDPEGAVIGGTGTAIALRTVSVPPFDIRPVALSDYVQALRDFVKNQGLVKDVGKEFNFADAVKVYKALYGLPGIKNDPRWGALDNLRVLEMEEEAMQAWEKATGKSILRRPSTQIPNAKVEWPNLAKAENLNKNKSPEGLMDGVLFDVYSPQTNNVSAMMSNLKDTKYGSQANNYVVNLNDSKVAPSELIREAMAWTDRMPNMRVMMIYKNHILTEVRFK